jgi:malonyl CoA-acyl carrier protein transacylase
MQAFQFGSGNRNLFYELNRMSDSLIGGKFLSLGKEVYNEYNDLLGNNILKNLIKQDFDFENIRFFHEKNYNSIINAFFIHMVQMYRLYNYKYERNKLDQKSYKNYIGIGHSVGLLAAVMASLNYESEEEFFIWLKKSLSFMISIVTRTQLEYLKLESKESNEISPMLSIAKINYFNLNKMVNDYNINCKTPLSISINNGCNCFVISGLKSDLNNFVNMFDNIIKQNGLISYLKCSVPFHSFILENSKKDIIKDNECIKFNVNKDLLSFPVLSSANGSNLQMENNLYEELIKELAYVPVDWSKVILNTVQYNIATIIDMGPSLPVNILTKNLLNYINYPIKIIS